MKHGKYIGPFRELRGCGALIRQDHGHSYGGRYVLAQFDRVKAPEADSMRYGWHCLPARHFKLRRSRSQAEWRRLRGPLKRYESDPWKGPLYMGPKGFCTVHDAQDCHRGCPYRV